jgi:hypothetical protein
MIMKKKMLMASFAFLSVAVFTFFSDFSVEKANAIASGAGHCMKDHLFHGCGNARAYISCYYHGGH